MGIKHETSTYTYDSKSSLPESREIEVITFLLQNSYQLLLTLKIGDNYSWTQCTIFFNLILFYFLNFILFLNFT